MRPLRRRPGEPGGPGREEIENNKWQQVFMGVALTYIIRTLDGSTKLPPKGGYNIAKKQVLWMAFSYIEPILMVGQQKPPKVAWS